MPPAAKGEEKDLVLLTLLNKLKGVFWQRNYLSNGVNKKASNNLRRLLPIFAAFF